MPKNNIIPKTADVQKAAEPVVDDAIKVMDLIEQTAISTHSGLANAVVWIAEIKKKISEVDEKRKSFTTPLREVIDKINAEFKPALNALELAEKQMKTKVSDYVILSKERRDGILAKIGNMEVSANEQNALLAEADKLEPPKISGLSIRDTWTGKVLDKKAIVEWAIENGRLEVLNVNEKALVAITKATDSDPDIPGWSATKNSVVAVTVSKVKS